MTNLTDANMNMKTQVTKYTNHMAIKDSSMVKMQKKIASYKGK